MTIPDYQTVMLPLLRFLSEGKEHHLQEAISSLAEHFELTEDERAMLLPSGRYPTFNSRVSWASSYIKAAVLIDKPRRGYMRITPRGIALLAERPSAINLKLLERYPEFVEFLQKARGRTKTIGTSGAGSRIVPDSPDDKSTPAEIIESAYGEMRGDLASNLLEQIKSCSPEFFERLVVDLLVKMGYGGTRAEAGRAVGKSGDGGIDGIINEDRLGLDIIYIQAKRWENTVGRPQIQQFAGALQGQKARKGVFLTTSDFSQGAREYAGNIESSLVLIDGTELAGLMMDHNLGVSLVNSYEIKRIDSDCFEEV